jgi:hypothetical protein
MAEPLMSTSEDYVQDLLGMKTSSEPAVVKVIVSTSTQTFSSKAYKK